MKTPSVRRDDRANNNYRKIKKIGKTDSFKLSKLEKGKPNLTNSWL